MEATGRAAASVRGRLGFGLALFAVLSLWAPAAASALGRLAVVVNTGVPDYRELSNFKYRPAISGDGRFVAYVSFTEAGFDGSFGHPLSLRDMRRQRTTVVSSSDREMFFGNENSGPSLSRNGRYLAFVSNEADVSREDFDVHRNFPTSPIEDVFLYDRLTKKTRLVSRRSGRHGEPAEENSEFPSISEDGRIVAFMTESWNLAPRPGPARPGGVYERDLTTERTHPISALPGVVPWHPASFFPEISGDGRRVAFGFQYSRWPYDPNHEPPLFPHYGKWHHSISKQVMLWDPAWRRPRLVSRADGPRGESPNRRCTHPSASRTGRFVAFTCKGSTLVAGDDNDAEDVFVRDVERGRTTLVSTPGTRPIANGDSDAPSISADGRFVAFASKASNLVPGDDDEGSDVFLKDLRTGHLTMISTGLGGESSNGRSGNPVLTPSATFLVYNSSATNITPQDASPDLSIYRVRLRP